MPNDVLHGDLFDAYACGIYVYSGAYYDDHRIAFRELPGKLLSLYSEPVIQLHCASANDASML